tara:strand:- start:1139 stop:2362 length:1224 start_codon:yes stop_codon:yes gene_type:complete
MNNKKILLVSHQFLPHLSPRTTRWKTLVDKLIEMGNEVTILTGSYPDETVENYNILYFGNKKISTTMNSIRKDANKTDNPSLKKIIYNLLKKIYRFLFKNFAWPDYAMFWIFTVYKNKTKISKDFDSIISVSLPFTSHVCASIIVKELETKWIMDIGDPFSLKVQSPENNKILYSFLNRFIEKKYYNKADKIFFTHQEVLDFHQKKFKIKKSKLKIGHPIFEILNENILLSKEYDYNESPINIGYFGIFTDKIREPFNYINKIANQLGDEFNHHWYINEESKKYFSTFQNQDNHFFEQLVPRDEAIKKMINHFHLLLSIGNTNKYQLPSKVIEYISLGKPVIHFAEIHSDPMYRFEKLFTNLKIINHETQPSDINNYLKTFQNGSFDFNYDNFIENFGSNAIIKELN